MKDVQMTIAVVGAMLLASVASAQQPLALQWSVTEGAGKGYLPKIASDGLNGLISLMFQTATGVATFQYEDGAMVVSDPSYVTWVGPYGVYTPTNPSDETGHEPSVAMAPCELTACTENLYYAANVIQVHQGNGADLWYRTGFTQGAITTWANAGNYDEGYNPTVALDRGFVAMTSTTVVEVHQAGVDMSELWYHVGTLNFSASTATVTWGPSYKTNFTGYAPTVAISHGVVVLVAQGTAPNMFYSIGAVNTSNNTIAWGAQTNYDTGYNPSITVQQCLWGTISCNFMVVEAHQGKNNATGSLYYRTGAMFYPSSGGAPTSISWAPNSSTEYATGCYPSVSVMTNNGGTYPIVESHSEACNESAQLIREWGLVVPNN
ncbi:MAG TPA: hypothetical protein VMB03_25010 [Bryobacteraceae bacterium]|nr:hypothetical protein [Bryobacteraceae bacterium]